MTDKSIDKREESLRVFSQTATIYDRIGPQIFGYFGQCLVELAGLNSGDAVLDVAAGRGALLFPVAVGKRFTCEIRYPVRHAVAVRNGAATGRLRRYKNLS